MKKVILSIKGMSCSGCANSLEKYLNKQDGVIKASVNLVIAQATIEYEDSLKISDLENFVSEAGFESLGEFNLKKNEKNKTPKINLIIYSFLATLVLYIAMASMLKMPMISFLDMHKNPINYTVCLLILTCPFFLYGKDILKSGFKNLKHLSFNMDTLVTLGVLTCFTYSVYHFILILKGNYMLVDNLYFESCCIIIYFIKLGRFLDNKGKEKSKQAISELVQITPEYALLKGEKQITIDEVKKKDILICKPGMKIAVDGVITKGKCHIDEAFITGEARPVKKKSKDKVLAGSLNIDGYIEYEALNIGKNSTISQIVNLVAQATGTKTKYEKMADRICSLFVPGVIIVALVTFLINLIITKDFSLSFTSFVSVLLVSCPCALGLATPLATVVSIGTCASKQILVKSTTILEQMGHVDTLIFDKTGTLTYGNLKIAHIFNYSKYSQDKLIEIAASLENLATHPIATAFKNYTQEHKLKLIPVNSFKNIEGLGIEGKISKKTYYVGSRKLINKLKLDNPYLKDEDKLLDLNASVIYLVENNNILALIGVLDTPRKEASDVIKKLKKQNIETILLSGDNEKTALAIAEEVGINQVYASVLPQDKTKIVTELQKKGKRVVMIGDGINDAPSLTKADIGISLASGTDIASSCADVILLDNDLKKILNLMEISKKTIKIIKQNLFWAFFYNVLMIPIATGLFRPFNIVIGPMWASCAMMFSSLMVIINALRLKKERKI